MSLDDLPDELLLFVLEGLSNLDSSCSLFQKDLKSLALISRRYYRLALPEIYRRAPKSNRTHLRLFSIEIIRKPELASFVHTIGSRKVLSSDPKHVVTQLRREDAHLMIHAVSPYAEDTICYLQKWAESWRCDMEWAHVGLQDPMRQDS